MLLFRRYRNPHAGRGAKKEAIEKIATEVFHKKKLSEEEQKERKERKKARRRQRKKEKDLAANLQTRGASDTNSDSPGSCSVVREEKEDQGIISSSCSDSGREGVANLLPLETAIVVSAAGITSSAVGGAAVSATGMDLDRGFSILSNAASSLLDHSQGGNLMRNSTTGETKNDGDGDEE